MDQKEIEQMSFKEASVELERVVRSLESGELELEESLEAYTKGVALLKSLKERLSTAEQKVQTLLDETKQIDIADTTAAPSNFLDE